ncbi:hypothetical protein ABI_08310 [Asticcacaulis biprosthecium C19]|uniref:4-oxalocrotonate tautomerase n=1 Tax=Asticcacaulis biprosthecium C19 TaxID=715226 RepID=F4QLX6_9CAUL|nr:hypothetical protein ABI_08310 [Asticcacaulis biprosthecium C19]
MPLTLTLTDGALSDTAQAEAIAEITEAFLAAHNLTGNRVMTPNVTAHVNILEKGRAYAGGKPVEGAWLETKTPAFALADQQVQEKFFGDVTEILHRISGGTLSRDRIWTNGVHTVDGTWNLNGRPHLNEELGAAIAKG